jgi:uncharacterized protein (DUF1015 family)
MAKIKPFRGFRPKAELVAQVACPPYDVLSSEEAREMAKGRPNSYLHVCKAEIDLPPEVDVHSEEVYSKARENFRAMVEKGLMAQDRTPCFYIYQQIMGNHAQAGVVAGASVDEYQTDKIKKHELTRQDKEDDRTRHIEVAGAFTEPVFLTYRATSKIDALVDGIRKRKPEYDFTTDDGVRHTFWVVDKPGDIGSIEKAFEEVGAMYVADGHHRSAASSRVREILKAKNNKHTGEEPYNYFLTVIFPHDQMQIMDYNRVVKDLNGLSEKEFLRRLSEKFEVSEAASPKPDGPKQWGMYLGGKWYRLKAKKGAYPENDPVGRLDVSILQNNVLAPILAVADPRKDKRIDFVGGIRGWKELEKRCSIDCKVAFQCHPTGIEDLIAIADAGKIMPPKSTWFEPKLRSGIFVKMFFE